MATNFAELVFEEDAEDVVVQLASSVNATTNFAATNLDMREHGVFADYVDGGNSYRVFIPWSNVLGLHQYLGA